MLGINKGLIWGQFRAPDKESVNTVERLREDFDSVDSISRALGRAMMRRDSSNNSFMFLK